jgi:outer membrane lipase/esterase
VGVQIELFLADSGRLTGDELIVIAAGSNELAWQPPYSPAIVVANLADHISRLTTAGGRTFLVPNLPSPGQNPANLGASTETRFDALTTVVNRRLDRVFPRLADDLRITIQTFDMDAVVGAVLRHPEDFGISDVTGPACPGCGIGIPAPDAAATLVPNPDEYLWWDFVHMTRVAHAIIGAAAADMLSLHSSSNNASSHATTGDLR